MPAHRAQVPATPLHAHLQAAGPVSANSPELLRLARKTGFSASHIFLVALGHRRVTRKFAMSIAPHVKGLTAASLLGSPL